MSVCDNMISRTRFVWAITLLLSTLFVAPTATAKVSYRGFVEAGAGAGDVANHEFGYMLATTHGIQWKKNFFGVGLGITPEYWVGEDNEIAVPVYFNWRYDFFKASKWNPYIGVKLGAHVASSDDSVFGALNFGYRLRVSAISGLSLGLGIQTSKSITPDTYYYRYGGSDIGCSILATVAFDF